MDISKIIEACKNIHKLIANHKKQEETLNELGTSLIHAVQGSENSGFPKLAVDVKSYWRLRAEYTKALNTNAEEFEFDGSKLATGYAYYLLTYLSPMVARMDGYSGYKDYSLNKIARPNPVVSENIVCVLPEPETEETFTQVCNK